MTYRKGLAALFLVALSALPASAQKPREAATPEEALRFFTEASRSGDLNAAIGQMASPVRVFFKQMQRSEALHRTFEKTLDQKFGKDPVTQKRPSLKEQLQSLKNLKVVEKKDRGKGVALLRATATRSRNGKQITDEQEFLVLKEGNAWKISPVPVDLELNGNVREGLAKQIEPMLKQLARAVEGLKKTTQALKAGKYKSRREAQQALGEAVFSMPPRPEGKKRVKKKQP
jgi:hypothetical protein